MQIIYLTGPSSVGKTTLAKALQTAFEEPFLHLSFDKVIGWMPQKFNDWTGDSLLPGFSFKAGCDDEGILIQQLNQGPFAQKMGTTFREVVLGLAKSGHHLIIDDFSLDLELWKDLLKDFSVLWVKLTAPLEVLEKREKERGFRIQGSARAQYMEHKKNLFCAMEINTHTEPMDIVIQKIQTFKSGIRLEILQAIKSIKPFDADEMDHLLFIQKWIASGADLFRTNKPNTPNPHLVAYVFLIDTNTNKILLVDHKKARLWLPAGGHVEINEHPKETVKREILEELQISADFLLQDPLFVTVTQTVGETAGHTDVSFWYVLKGDSEKEIQYDHEEFHDVCWFPLDEIPFKRTDPHMQRFIRKLQQTLPDLKI